ncbi:hypothetical protein GCM10009788_05940 [Nocardioides humi]|uniref:ABC3 transporter permease C-terminal domain-containing protein n=1 Tax=Nocardioides humi TaxID=449461 RepID=A0ABN1ZVA5_9ACTN
MRVPVPRRARPLLRLAAAERRARPGRARAVVVIVALGAALLTAALVLGDTLRASVEQGLAVEYRGADIVVRSDLDPAGTEPARGDGIPSAAVRRIERLDGVAEVATSVRATAVAQTRGTARGIALESLPDAGRFVWQGWSAGRPPADGTEIALTAHTLRDLGIGLGDQVAVGSPRVGRALFRVVGVVDVRGSLGREGSAYGVVTAPVAQSLAGGSGPNVLLVDAEPGADLDAIVAAINERAPVGWPQLTRDLERAAEDVHGVRAGALGLVAAALAGVTLGIGVVALATTSGAATRSRRRSLALARCLGATRRQVVGLTLAEVLLPSALGAVLGVVLGALVARLLLPVLDLVPGLYPLRADAFTLRPLALLGPLLVMVLLAAVAALVPAVLAARVASWTALGGATGADAARPRRWPAVAGAVAVVAGPALAGLAVDRGTPRLLAPAVLLTVAGTLLLVAPVLSAVARLARRRTTTPAVRLALADIVRRPVAAATEAVAVLLAVAVLALTWVTAAGVAASTSARLDATVAPDLTIGAPAGAAVVGDETLAGLADVDGVATVVPVPYGAGVRVVGRSGGERVELSVGTVALDAGDLRSVLPAGDAIPEIRGDAVYLPETAFPPFPRDSTLSLAGPDGRVRDLAVVYVPDLPVPSAVAPDTLRAAAHACEVREAWLRLDAGVDRARVVDEVTGVAVLGGELPVAGPVIADVRADRAIRTARSAGIAVLAVGVLVAIVGAVATAAVTISERTREYAVLRALGLERRALARMLVTRVALVGLVAAVGGILLGSAVGVLLTRAIADGIDLTPVVRVPLLPVVAIAVLTVLVVRAAATAALEQVSFVPPARVLARR